MWTRAYWMVSWLCAALLSGCPFFTEGEWVEPPDPALVRAGEQRHPAPGKLKRDSQGASSEALQTAQATASHILVTYVGASRADPDVDRSREDARARAKQVLERARDGENFAALAREFSDGPSGPRGGKLGAFPRGRMVPAFDDVVFAMHAGTVATELVETPFGFHIIYREK